MDTRAFVEKKQKHYELTCLLIPDLSEQELASWAQKITAAIDELDGTVIEQTSPKRQQLAYSIRHYQQANYITVQFRGPRTLVPDFKDRFRHETALLRHLFVEKPPERKRVPAPAPIPTTVKEKLPAEETKSAAEKEEMATQEIDKRLKEILGT